MTSLRYIIVIVLMLTNIGFCYSQGPAEVVVKNLSVTGVNEATLTWVKPNSTNIVEYKILRYNLTTQGFDEISTINNPNITVYTDQPIGTTIESYIYKVFAIDDLGNLGTSEDYFNTIFASDKYNQCDVSVDFTWNPYIDGQSGNNTIFEDQALEFADNYELWIDSGTGFILIQTLSPGTHNFTYNNVPRDVNLKYQIRANLPNGEVSLSNIDSVFTQSPPISTENYIKNTSVIDDESVVVEFHLNPIISNNSIHLYRSKDGNSPVFIDSLSSGTLSYIDEEVEVSESFYSYFFELEDECFNVRNSSNSSNSILLNVDYDDYENFPILSWNQYSEYQKGVEKYVIERNVNGVLSFTDTVPSNQTFYNDTLLSVQMSAYSSLCYNVIAVEADTNSFGFKEESLSNSFCLDDKTTVYIPSGFVLNGRSGDFKPIFTYVTEEDYRFLIYNRWGQVVFETKDPYLGWNGMYNNNYVPVGAYAYKLFYKDDLNEQNYVTGSVTVIK